MVTVGFVVEGAQKSGWLKADCFGNGYARIVTWK